MRHIGIGMIALLLWIVCGCAGQSEQAESGAAPVVEAAEPAPKKRVSDRAANTLGTVFIVEYHQVKREAGKYDRSPEQFKKDLERLYKLGFRPVSLRSYLDNQMDLAPGASPVIFTFDDSSASQFRLLDDGSVDPDCAVGVWQAFANEHPDFPVLASFFVLPPTPWAQPNHLDRKLQLLKEWGCDLGSHTVTHANLAKLSDHQVKQELSGATDFLKEQGFDPYALALPLGMSPKNKSLLKGFQLDGKSYGHEAVLLVGAGPAPSPEAPEFDPMRLPRIQATEEDYALTFWLDLQEEGKVKPYVAP